MVVLTVFSSVVGVRVMLGATTREIVKPFHKPSSPTTKPSAVDGTFEITPAGVEKKALVPTVGSLPKKDIEVSAELSWNAYAPISVTPLPTVIEVRARFTAKAYDPIVVTELGIVRVVRALS